ncbi:unnamed protein product [Allacma fusca]|uniref:Protein kinase domain-containing protein n=1 Tax=Allacma fusca TaxID=39272 RepID=A0A8J2LNP3_9HEXA|nr:unnamed protein product [Allacma fusca]
MFFSKRIINMEAPVKRRESESLPVTNTKERDQIRYSMLLTGYNKALEFPRESIQIDFNEKISHSAFTIIYKGLVTQTENESGQVVAVKTLKENAELLFFKALVRELKILSSMEEHENIVSLLGACTSSIHLGQIFIVVEYCEKGTLENYLRSRRSGFVNKFLPARPCNEVAESIYENFSTMGAGALSTVDLLRWSIQVAKGMEYLSENNLIHWELATRSVFLDSRLTAKLGDFHSLRKLQPGAEYFILTDTVPLPWKWMAVESVKELKFSLKSDVWTYGITFWEIFTLGEDPYVGSSYGSTFFKNLDEGTRPYHHTHISDQLYNLMKKCWSGEPANRPSFLEIITTLNVALNELSIIPYI